MRNLTTADLFVATMIVTSGSSFAATVMVGGQKMLAYQDIVENLDDAGDLTTLLAAVKAAGLVSTLRGNGPFTLFAPSNAAFAKVPADDLAALLRPENRAALVRLLSYHILEGKYDFNALETEIRRQGGLATLNGLGGGKLRFAMNGHHNISLMDEQGRGACIGVYDAYQSNGVVHVVDTVLMRV